jgi:hypothetical protein
MHLRGIQWINWISNSLLFLALAGIFGGLAISIVSPSSEPLGSAVFLTGFGMVFTALLLSLVIDRVRCPKCGKTFNRPHYSNWFARHFSKTSTRRTCANCDYGAEDA